MSLDMGMSRYDTPEQDYLDQYAEPDDLDPGDPYEDADFDGREL